MLITTHSKRRIELCNIYLLLQALDPNELSLPMVYAIARNVKALTPIASAHDKYILDYEANEDWKRYQDEHGLIDSNNISALEEHDKMCASIIDKRKADTKLLYEYLDEIVAVELVQLPMSLFPANYSKKDFISLVDIIDHEG